MNELMFRDPEVYMPDMSNMFKRLEALFDYDFNKQSKGLKRIISRPHNLITTKDENGNITGYQIHVVYTPFKRDDVKVEINDNMLIVKCGSENKIKDENMLYCGISNQSYEFSLPLSETIDIKKISAKAEDGMLYIDLPLKKEVETAPTVFSIPIN